MRCWQSTRSLNTIFLAKFLLCDKHPCKTVAGEAHHEVAEPIQSPAGGQAAETFAGTRVGAGTTRTSLRVMLEEFLLPNWGLA